MNTLCRVCLSIGNITIFNSSNLQDSISNRLIECTSLKVHENDGYPTKICQTCLTELDVVYQFQQKCKNSEAQWKKNTTDYGIDNSHILVDDSSGCSNDIKVDESYDDIDYIKCKSNHSRNPDVGAEPLLQLVNHLDSNTHIKPIKSKGQQILKSISKSKKQISEDGKQQSNTVKDERRKHMCPQCGKTFISYGNLLDHERVHSGDKPYACDICNRRFTQSGHLIVHSRTHTGIKPYQCKVCSKSFSVSHTLKVHLRTHTGERPYECYCSKTFTTSYHLACHSKRHIGDKKYKCDWPGCRLRYINTSEMKRHRAIHENLNKPSRAKSKKLNNPIIGFQ